MSTLQNQNFIAYQQPALTNTLVLLRAGVSNLWGWNLTNTNAAIAFVQCFNAASTGAVTLGTTAPDFIIAIPTGSGSQVFNMNNEENIQCFPLGLVVAATTTATGSTGLGSAINTTFYVD